MKLQKEHFAGILLGASVVLAVVASSDTSSERALVREQFHLGSDVRFEAFRRSKANWLVQPRQIEAIARFNEHQFEDYAHRLPDPALWHPVPLRYEGRTFQGASVDDAFRWRPADASHTYAWSSLSARRVQDVRGRAEEFCVEWRQNSEGGNEAASQAYPCRDPNLPAQHSGDVAIIQGFLDHETRSLHMVIRGVRAD